MLIFCFKFSHVHDLSLYCQHHYLILPVSSTQVLPSVWCIDHVMAGCGWQEFWRGKMWIGCACFSLDITWVLCFKQWGACTQQKVLRGQGKYLEWLNAEYIQHRVLITSVWLYLFFSLLCPPPCPGHRGGPDPPLFSLPFLLHLTLLSCQALATLSLWASMNHELPWP